jgi:hypothetical protein
MTTFEKMKITAEKFELDAAVVTQHSLSDGLTVAETAMCFGWRSPAQAETDRRQVLGDEAWTLLSDAMQSASQTTVLARGFRAGLAAARQILRDKAVEGAMYDEDMAELTLMRERDGL